VKLSPLQRWLQPLEVFLAIGRAPFSLLSQALFFFSGELFSALGSMVARNFDNTLHTSQILSKANKV